LYKIINDPVFGFIQIPKGLLLDIVNHPLMQRLTRINQLGMSSVVYPGARHTRFLHSIGAYHLMREALTVLRQKGNFIFDSEAEAVEAAILMHDVGHAPFSHVLENTLIHGISHEEISLMMMEQINRDLGSELNLALKIFKNEYPKRFLHQLISSQLDMDRLDYLKRDSFFTGVDEGNIGSARIIKMLQVADDRLVVDAKGLYTIENYLTSRQSMYWQVYLHKTTVACEKVLIGALRRAKWLTEQGHKLFASPALDYFLRNHVDAEWFSSHPEALKYYEELEDNDIWTALKVWRHDDDKILNILCNDILDRKVFKAEVFDAPPLKEHIDEIAHSITEKFGVSGEDLSYLMNVCEISSALYQPDSEAIEIIYKNGHVEEITEASELLNVHLLSKKIRKYYLLYQRI